MAQDPRIENIIPRWERWQVHWTPTDLQDYARQLDFFRIELGAVGGGTSVVDYVSNASKAQPDSKQGAGPDEKRLFMSWRGKGGKLVDFDKAILAKAGVSTRNRVLLQFYPNVVQDQLAWIEKMNGDKLGHKSLEDYLKTIFGVRPKGRGYEFYVEEQRFRPAPR